MKRERDIFDFLPPEANKAIDKHGYAFLKAQGYPWRKERKLKKELHRQGRELRYCYTLNENKIVFWFELYSGETIIAKSEGIKFVMQGGENAGQEGGGSEEGPSPFAEFDA